MIFDDIAAKLNRRTALPLLNPVELFDTNLSRTIRNANLPGLVTCGLLVWNDDIAAAHPIAQEMDNIHGNYWHAMIHRREGDYWNAKYWFRLVGNHPVQVELTRMAEARSFLKKGVFMPGLMVDACERANERANERASEHANAHAHELAQTGTNAGPAPVDDEIEALQRLQLAEIKALLNYCRLLPAN